MTSRDTLFAYTENLNVWKTKQDSEKLKTPFRLIGKCCSDAFKIGSMIFWSQWHFKILMQWTSITVINILTMFVYCIISDHTDSTVIQRATNNVDACTHWRTYFLHVRART